MLSKPKNGWTTVQIKDSLYEMIGYGVTGLYPHLEKHKEELETKIEEYINFLK